MGRWQDLCHLLHRKTKKGQRQERNAHSSATQSAISCRRSRISKGIGLEPPRQPRQWYKVYTEELKKRSHSHRLKLEWQLTHSEDFTVAIIPRSRSFTCPLFVRQPSQQVGIADSNADDGPPAGLCFPTATWPRSWCR